MLTYSVSVSLASTFRLEQLPAFGTAVHVKFVSARNWFSGLEIVLDRLLVRVSAAVQSIVSREVIPVQKVFIADGAVIMLAAMSLVLAQFFLG